MPVAALARPIALDDADLEPAGLGGLVELAERAGAGGGGLDDVAALLVGTARARTAARTGPSIA